nr:immunoglobulin light chain junction region [Macaca mulatta]
DYYYTLYMGSGIWVF